MSAASILVIRGLEVRFGGHVAVAGLDLDVPRGGITAVIGANGAGKSTLFNLISGALRPAAGSILFEGASISGLSVQQIRARGIARSFQLTNLFLPLSVYENLRLATQVHERSFRSLLPLRFSRQAAERAEQLMQRFQLTDQRLRPARQLSHGEQRRLEIAMALASEPSLLLLDEPTQGMSHADAAESAALLQELARERTLLVVEHNIGFVMQLSDRVVVMHRGAKLAEGTPAQVKANPEVQSAYLGRI